MQRYVHSYNSPCIGIVTLAFLGFNELMCDDYCARTALVNGQLFICSSLPGYALGFLNLEEEVANVDGKVARVQVREI